MKRKWPVGFGKKRRVQQSSKRRLLLAAGIFGALAIVDIITTVIVALFLNHRSASVELPNYYSENMVFQWNKPIVIKGKTSPNIALNIQIGNSTSRTTADATGNFTTQLLPVPAQLEPYSLSIKLDTGRVIKTISQVYSGNVFLAAGQSNMELSKAVYYGNEKALHDNTHDGDKKIIDIKQLPDAINDSNVHFLVTKDITSGDGSNLPLQDINKSGWATANSTKNTDWLGYLPQQFALNMRKAQPDIPIGIIQTAWGGTNITRHMRGGDIYRNHIAPLDGYNIAGILWYQGEADANDKDASKYAERLSLMIGQYRSVFGDDASLPFVQFQLANFKYASREWDDIRDAQAEVAKSTYNTAIVDAKGTERSTTALIHPLGKDTLGKSAAKKMLELLNNN